MKEITVIARAKAKLGSEKELENALRAVTSPTHDEPGCLRYAVHRDIQDPQTFVVVERWASLDDHTTHMNSKHVQELFKKVPDLVAAQPEIRVFELLPMGQEKKGSL